MDSSTAVASLGREHDSSSQVQRQPADKYQFRLQQARTGSIIRVLAAELHHEAFWALDMRA